jgi:opacity protein-like surface antigen
MKKMLLATAALAAVIASPALAQAADGVWAASEAWNGRPQPGYTQAPGVYGPLGAYAQVPAYGAFGAYARVPGAYGAYARSASPDVGLGGDYVGTDPDANIQLQLLKDAQSRE